VGDRRVGRIHASEGSSRMPTCKAIADARSGVSRSGSPLLAGAAGIGLFVLIDGYGGSDARSERLFSRWTPVKSGCEFVICS
jgi:hypothetical protein